MVRKRKLVDEEKLFLSGRANSSVTCKLSAVCRPNLILVEIQRTLIEMKQCQLEASRLANYHVLRCIHGSIPHPDPNDKFYRDCCAGVMKEAEVAYRTTGKLSIDAQLLETLKIFWSERAQHQAYKPPSLNHSNRMRAELARAMAVNAQNMIALQFRKRLYQYVRFRYAKEGELELTAQDTRRLVESCYRVKEVPAPTGPDASPPIPKRRKTSATTRTTKKPKMVKLWDAWAPTTDTDEQELRDWLGMTPWDWKIKKNLTHFIRRLYDMMSFLEPFAATHPRTKGTKLYSRLPCSTSFEPCYITLNGTTLHEICLRVFERTAWKLASVSLGAKEGLANEKYFQTHRSALLREVFSVNQFETRQIGCLVPKAIFDEMDHEIKKKYASRNFRDQVMTDGYSAQVLLTHPKDQIQSNEPSDDRARVDTRDPFVQARKKLSRDYVPDVMIGVDPGMRTLCTAVSTGRLKQSRRVRKKWLQKRKQSKGKKLDRAFRRGQKITEISTGEYRHLAEMNDFSAGTRDSRPENPCTRRCSKVCLRSRHATLLCTRRASPTSSLTFGFCSTLSR